MHRRFYRKGVLEGGIVSVLKKKTATFPYYIFNYGLLLATLLFYLKVVVIPKVGLVWFHPTNHFMEQLKTIYLE